MRGTKGGRSSPARLASDGGGGADARAVDGCADHTCYWTHLVVDSGTEPNHIRVASETEPFRWRRVLRVGEGVVFGGLRDFTELGPVLRELLLISHTLLLVKNKMRGRSSWKEWKKKGVKK